MTVLVSASSVCVCVCVGGGGVITNRLLSEHKPNKTLEINAHKREAVYEEYLWPAKIYL